MTHSKNAREKRRRSRHIREHEQSNNDFKEPTLEHITNRERKQTTSGRPFRAPWPGGAILRGMKRWLLAILLVTGGAAMKRLMFRAVEGESGQDNLIWDFAAEMKPTIGAKPGLC